MTLWYSRTTEVTIGSLPQDSVNASLFEIKIQYRGPGDLYAVTRHGQVLGRQGQWTYEPTPSSRTDRFKSAYRFPFDEAEKLAHKALPKLTSNGLTADQVLEWERKRKAERKELAELEGQLEVMGG